MLKSWSHAKRKFFKIHLLEKQWISEYQLAREVNINRTLAQQYGTVQMMPETVGSNFRAADVVFTKGV